MNTPDIAIINATILPMGGADRIHNGVLTIIGNTIDHVGGNSPEAIKDARRIIDAKGRIVMPGFVNCHTHNASNMLLRGLLEDVKLFEWLQTMWQLKRNFDPETLFWASQMGLVEMVKAGFIPMFNDNDPWRGTGDGRPGRSIQLERSQSCGRGLRHPRRVASGPPEGPGAFDCR